MMKNLKNPEQFEKVAEGSRWELLRHIPTGEYYYSDDTLTLAYVENCEPEEFVKFQNGEGEGEPTYSINETTEADLVAAGIELEAE